MWKGLFWLTVSEVSIFVGWVLSLGQWRCTAWLRRHSNIHCQLHGSWEAERTRKNPVDKINLYIHSFPPFSQWPTSSNNNHLAMTSSVKLIYCHDPITTWMCHHEPYRAMCHILPVTCFVKLLWNISFFCFQLTILFYFSESRCLYFKDALNKMLNWDNSHVFIQGYVS